MVRILLLLMIFISCTSHAYMLPAEAFGSLPATSQVKLSPDGEKIAYMENIQGQKALVTMNLNSGEKKYLIQAGSQNFEPDYYHWANNKMILVSARYPHSVRAVKTRLLKFHVDGSLHSEPVLKLRRKDRKPQFQHKILDILPDDPDHILMSLALENSRYPTVYKVNLTNPKVLRKRIKKWHPNVLGWKTDRQHRVRLGYGRNKATGFYQLFDLQTNKWRRIWDYEIYDEPGVVPLGFAKDPSKLYVRADLDGRYAIFRVDLSKADLPRELVYADPNYDVNGSLIYSQKTNDVIGVFHSEAEGAKVFFDAKHQAFQKTLDQIIPNAYNQVASYSADEQKYVLFTRNSKRPGAYYLGDLQTKSLDYVAEQYPLLFEQSLSGKQKITYWARDKVKIEGYLTMPHGGIKTNNPAIILPHGGPNDRDYGHYDWLSEFFASRGYVVLQPNFRGSSGYGFEFKMKSNRDWGGAMQDDLADAATWLINSHSVDSQSICILGASYGGYAALMAAVKQQHIFKCAASFAGFVDLNLLFQDARYYRNFDIVKKQLGSDSKKLKQQSPITYIEKINIPIMMIHGERDTVVDVKHSRNMHKVLQKHNKQVEYIELKEGDHALSNEANRLLVLSSFERFLNQHIPVSSERFN